MTEDDDMGDELACKGKIRNASYRGNFWTVHLIQDRGT
jgi:hypothetical protein